MALGFTRDPRQQGRSGNVPAEPMEIVDPPLLYTDDVLRRFPSLMQKQVDFAKWWEHEKEWKLAVLAQLDALRKKVNAL